THLFSERLAQLQSPANLILLSQCTRGIERECLRVDEAGHLAMTAHLKSLGSSLTHPQITTDYSESLLEFITPAIQSLKDTLHNLETVHSFTAKQLQNELLWSASMPCQLPEETSIPIAQYGKSYIGQLKYVYRKGLDLRYGKAMQCIAGIHYNFSLPEELLQNLKKAEKNKQSTKDYQSDQYMGLIRNFKRYSWILMYLFGASPALDKSFKNSLSNCVKSSDETTFFLPYATSLRMSNVGYQSHAQETIDPCFNTLENYTQSLRKAVSTSYPRYEEIGTHNKGQWQQLNTNILQIENEFYSSIRPKRITQDGETPIQALNSRGIQYIEVRCLDNNPYLPSGIDSPQAHFVEAFLLYCFTQDSPLLNQIERNECNRNFTLTVTQGLQPNLELTQNNISILLADWSKTLLEGIEKTAQLLDSHSQKTAYLDSVKQQYCKIQDRNLTPSAKILDELNQGKSFLQFALEKSIQHTQYFKQKSLSPKEHAALKMMAEQSLKEQKVLESMNKGSFDNFIKAYQDKILA
ncbi:UNVERIFIED_CONTAM: hypothetical protein GTU68_039023, partial [Idotea baltica]|nr:hypothetical protein [Idotea baltica]